MCRAVPRLLFASTLRFTGNGFTPCLRFWCNLLLGFLELSKRCHAVEVTATMLTFVQDIDEVRIVS